MQKPNDIFPPFNYTTTWLIAGIICITLIIGMFVGIFFITRKKKVKKINDLKAATYVKPDISAIKQKYLALLAEIEKQHTAGTTKERESHQLLSITVRLFVYEATGAAVHNLTLSDIKQTRYENLGSLIEEYYPIEFDELIKNASFAVALKKAQELVTSWV